MAIDLREFASGDAISINEIWENSLQNEGFDPYSTLTRTINEPLIVATIDDRIVGCSDMRSWTEGELHVYLVNGVVNPEDRNKGVASQMLTEMERRIRGIHQNEAPAVFGANATSTNPSGQDFLVQNGYREVFSMVEMQVEKVVGTTLSIDFEVRKPATDELAQAQRLNMLAYKGRAFAAIDETETVEEWVGAATDLSLWSTAWDGETLVGFVFAVNRGEFFEICEVTTHPDYRRRGIARHLLRSVLNKCNGVVRLHTSGENVSGARSLYAGVGFKEVRTHFRYRKPLA